MRRLRQWLRVLNRSCYLCGHLPAPWFYNSERHGLVRVCEWHNAELQMTRTATPVGRDDDALDG